MKDKQYYSIKEEWIAMKTRKIVKMLLAGISLAGVVCLAPSDGNAVTGRCYECHTMHASQHGDDTLDFLGNATLGTAVPYETLLKEGCWGCHAGVDNDVAVPLGTPQVDDNDGALIAGGFFVASSAGDAAFHNVADFDGSDSNFVTSSGVIPGTAQSYAINKFSCLGYTDGAFTKACHSTGGHHGNAAGNLTTPTTVAKSFRFLSGVKGYEDPDWQHTNASTNAAGSHNLYFAENVAFGGGGVATTGTLDSKCAECHGYFHSRNADNTGIKGTTTWTRHPTDIAYPATGEYATYVPTTAYDTNVPVGYTDTTPGSVAGPAVICLSCHWAHGGYYADLLRFSYGTMNAHSGANTTGCFKCHALKDT